LTLANVPRGHCGETAKVDGRSRILDILTLCETRNIDYGDAALVAAAKGAMQPLPILSNDQDFRKVPAVTAFSPAAWLRKGRQLLSQ
jgi:hypothetical protein